MNEGTVRSFGSPDERSAKGGVQVDVVHLGDIRVKRAVYPPGWVFSRDMGTPTCYDTHVGYAISGRLVVDLADGHRLELGPGSAFIIPAGHDAHVVGDEPFVAVQFDEGESAARRFNVHSIARAA